MIEDVIVSIIANGLYDAIKASYVGLRSIRRSKGDPFRPFKKKFWVDFDSPMEFFDKVYFLNDLLIGHNFRWAIHAFHLFDNLSSDEKRDFLPQVYWILDDARKEEPKKFLQAKKNTTFQKLAIESSNIHARFLELLKHRKGAELIAMNFESTMFKPEHHDAGPWRWDERLAMRKIELGEKKFTFYTRGQICRFMLEDEAFSILKRKYRPEGLDLFKLQGIILALFSIIDQLESTISETAGDLRYVAFEHNNSALKEISDQLLDKYESINRFKPFQYLLDNHKDKKHAA